MEKTQVNCPIEEALNLIGDKWTLLIVRDIIRGVNRFDTLKESLKISRNVLTMRLAELEKADIVYKSPVKPGAKRMLYNPTPKCLALLPTIVSLMEWTSQWSNTEDKTWSKVIDKETRLPLRTQIVNQQGQAVPLTQIKISFGKD
ncbi:MAG: winged helix-turn-helix transcriptional regulator [Bermanella sp.]